MQLRENAEICCPTTFLSERVYSACEFLIEKGNDLCNNVCARLVVMTIPETTQLSQNGLKQLIPLALDPKSFNPDLPDKKISEICSKSDIPICCIEKLFRGG